MAFASFLFHKSDYRLIKLDSLISIIVNNSRNEHGANVSEDCPTLFFRAGRFFSDYFVSFVLSSALNFGWKESESTLFILRVRQMPENMTTSHKANE